MDTGSSDTVRVLHVDDEPDVAELTSTYLERENDRFLVETATSADDALEKLTADVDCLVSDYDMPGRNGLELFDAVREEYPDLPFILFTGKGSEQIASEAISAGVTDYLQKQVGSEQYELLANRIANAVEQSRAARRAREHRRVSTVVREINQMLAHATSRTEINQRVCDIFADADPYVFAWIGTVDPETRRIVPQARAGTGDGYADDITITADDSASGQGPGGVAIRNGRVAVCQDIRTDEAFRRWREPALARGFRSVASIPLTYDDTRYGLLNVYADQAGTFDEAERELLSELGDTIGYTYHRLTIQQQYHDQYRELFEDAPVMLASTRTVDGQPVIDDCNRLFAETLGYTREELRGRGLGALYADESAGVFPSGGRDRVSSGEFGYEQRAFVTAEGDVVTTLLQTTPRRNAEGDVIGTHRLYTDITDQSHLQNLQALSERLSFALEATDSVLFELDFESGMKGRHGPFERIFGVESDRVDTAEAFFEHCVHPDDRETVREIHRPEALDDESGTVECEFRTHPDWSNRWIRTEAYVSTDADGTPQRLIGLDIDITEDRARQQERKEAQRRFRTLFEQIPTAIVEVEYEGLELIVVDVNPAFEEIFGYDAETIVGEPLDDFIVPEELQDEASRINKHVTSGGRLDAREVTRLTDSGPREFLLENALYDDNSGGFAIYTDVTDRIERKRELERQNERLDEFVSIVSHDLRNPLNVATTSLELARTECDHPTLEKVANAHDRMETLIEDLLTVAHEGEAVSIPEPVDLAALVDSCWATVDTADATLSTAIDEGSAIRADESRLKQLCENLVRNAVEHGGEDVTVTVGLLDDGFYLEDDGAGIPEDERDRVFEAGYSTSDDGTGFGLRIVKQVADAHGWDIRVTDGTDGGARFEVRGVDHVG